MRDSIMGCDAVAQYKPVSHSLLVVRVAVLSRIFRISRLLFTGGVASRSRRSCMYSSRVVWNTSSLQISPRGRGASDEPLKAPKPDSMAALHQLSQPTIFGAGSFWSKLIGSISCRQHTTYERSQACRGAHAVCTCAHRSQLAQRPLALQYAKELQSSLESQNRTVVGEYAL